jgi:hypothetical protein
MADAALFIGWGHPARGREVKAVQVFAETMAYWAKLQADGVIEGFEAYLIPAGGSDLTGFFLLKGEMPKLMEVQRWEPFQRTLARADLIVDGLRVLHAYSGETLAAQLAMYNEQLAELV